MRNDKIKRSSFIFLGDIIIHETFLDSYQLLVIKEYKVIKSVKDIMQS